MTKSLRERMLDGKELLEKVNVVMAQNSALLHSDALASFDSILQGRNEIPGWLLMLDAREAAKQNLVDLEQHVDADDRVPYGVSRVKYQIGRFLATQAYVSTTWGLADSMMAMIGRTLCNAETGKNEASPPQLVTNFVNKQKTKTSTAAIVFDSIRASYGWPIGISYAVRNHFIHDGAHTYGTDFFEGPTSVSGFKISAIGWDAVTKRATQNYNVNSTFHRAGAPWPTTPLDDLRVILNLCETEMDDAMGILLGSACATVEAHVGFMLGQD